MFSFWQEPWQSSARGIPLAQRGSKQQTLLWEAWMCPLCLLTRGDLGQAGFCFPAHHPTLSWELGGPTRSLDHLLVMFCQRSCCHAVYSMAVPRQHVAPSASPQPPRHLPKSRCPLSSLFAQPFALYLFSPALILVPFLPDLCQKGKETRFLSPSNIPVIDATKIILKIKMCVAHTFQILSSTGSM